MSDAERIVIVGASLAGARAAEGAREAGFEGSIVLIGEEPERPYERPPLSKDYLRGEKDDLSWVHEESFYLEQDIDLRTSTVVSRVDRSAKTVLIEGSEPEPWDRLLVCWSDLYHNVSKQRPVELEEMHPMVRTALIWPNAELARIALPEAEVLEHPDRARELIEDAILNAH